MKKQGTREQITVDVDTTAVDTLSAELAAAVAPQAELETAPVEGLFDDEKKLEEEVALSEGAIQTEAVEVAAADNGVAAMVLADTNAQSSGGASTGGSAAGGMSTGMWVAAGVGAAAVGYAVADDDDSDGGSKSSTPANRAPEAVASQAVSVDEGDSTVISINATDADGDSLTYSPTQPANGSLAVNGSNQFTYTPDAGFIGTDTFDVVISDGKTNVTQTITVTVEAAGQSSGDQYTLTNDIDIATAHEFNAPLVYTPGGNDRINSLQDEDVLTGTAASDDVINVSVGSPNDASAGIITPTLNDIEIFNAEFSSNAASIDLQDATGMQQVNVSRVGGAGATVQNIGGDVGELSIRNTSVDANIALTHKDADLSGSQEVDVNFDNAPVGNLMLGSTNFSTTEQIEVFNFNILSDSHVSRTLNLGADGLANTTQQLNINAGGRFQLGSDSDPDGDGLVNFGFAGALNGLGGISVSGAGDVILAQVGNDAGFVLDGATHTGQLQVDISSAAGDDDASFTSGSGNDFLYSRNSLSGELASGEGDDVVQIQGDLNNNENPAGPDTAASVSTGAGNDTASVQDVEQNAVLSTGAGDDMIRVNGNVDAAIVGNTDSDVDALVDAGAGDDVLVFGAETDFLDSAPMLNGDIKGGDGNDRMSITAEQNVAANSSTLSVTGVETLDLIARQTYTGFNAGVFNNASGSNTTADFNVDLQRFDSALSAINIDNQDAITLMQDGYNQNLDGDTINVTLDNVTNEAISITSVETTRNATDTGEIVDRLGQAPSSWDVNLTLNQAANSVATDSQALTLMGDSDFDVSIVDNGTDQIENLTLDIQGAGDHAIDLNADFEGNLVITGGSTGELTVQNVEATNVDSTAHNGNAYFQIIENAKHSLKTGAGNDQLDLQKDTVNGQDVIDMGDGTDRIMVANTLGDYATPNSSDDEVFEGFVSIEQIHLHDNANLVMNEDAFATGVERVIVDSSSNANSGIRLGNDFDRDLRVDVEKGANVELENDADVNLDVYVTAGRGGVDQTKVNFLDAGVNNTVSVTAQLASLSGADIDGILNVGNAGENININVDEGTIASITLTEGSGSANGDSNGNGIFNAGEGDNAQISVIVDDAWARVNTTLKIDASGIDDFDSASQVVGFRSGTTGGAVINGAAEQDAKLEILGTANDDVITGGDEGDTLTGGAGRDTFNYTFAEANDSTSQSADTITDFEQGDLILVDAGLVQAGQEFLVSHATVSGLAEGDNSLDGAVGDERIGDSFFATGTNQFVIDVNGDGDVQDGVDIVINVNNFNASQVSYKVEADAAGSTITTGAGRDEITGGAGNDTLAGGLGADMIDLTAGGSDTVKFNALGESSGVSVDEILGFISGDDSIEIDEIGVFGQDMTDFNFTSANSSAAKSFVASGANNGEVEFVFDQDNEILWVDANDDGALNASDLQVHLSGAGALVKADVVFA